jgi:NitT/TauT family transport system ATP-binding protein
MAAEGEIVLEDVTKRFDALVAVENLSLTVRPGEVVGIVGPSGAGKSTVLHAILGAIAVDRGRVRVAGCDPYRERERLRGRLGVAFQNDRLLPWRRAWENVAIGLEVMHVPAAKRREVAHEWLARVKMSGAEDKYPHELSGGMRQRVSFARAMAVSPAILLLDETFNQLDEVTSRTLRAEFLEVVHAMRTTCMLVTHRIEEAVESADRVLVFGRPARVCHEVAPSPGERTDPRRLAGLRAEIQAVMEQRA